MLDLFPSREGPGRFRAQAQAAQRVAAKIPGERPDRLPRCRQDHAAAPLSSVSPKAKATAVVHQRVRQASASNERAPLRGLERRRLRCSANGLPVLQLRRSRPARRMRCANLRRRGRAAGARLPQIQAHRDRDQRARRSRPGPAGLRHGPGALGPPNSNCRGRPHRRGNGRRRPRHAGVVGRGEKADHPRRPAGPSTKSGPLAQSPKAGRGNLRKALLRPRSNPRARRSQARSMGDLAIRACLASRAMPPAGAAAAPRGFVARSRAQRMAS